MLVLVHVHVVEPILDSLFKFESRFIVYNGAEARIPATLALLERLLGMEATRIDDPTVVVDVQIITGADLPTLP